MDFDSYQGLRFERPAEGVLLITLDRPEKLNAADEVMHAEFARVWLDVDADPETRVAVVTGAGRAFSAGGDMAMIERQTKDYAVITKLLREAGDVVYNMIRCEKPIISAINGVAVGAGLAIAIMADISIIAEEARLTDGHLRLGVGAGDHAAIIWPLLCGMAKAKYYLLTAEFIDGREAERIGLVSRAVPGAELLDTALGVAGRLAAGPQVALRLTKRSLNQWLVQAGPIFESSLHAEMLTFFGDDVVEGRTAVLEKRAPVFRDGIG
ncbi:enoyl-CoA hydratase/isomerase family protein [Pseudonocardia humida]|uniref:Enoyl-CoA hydratase/isomerase family protein n=1 Tax=Pseudonocardia humida TaxID=2800819 RepID=A0ABT1A0A3_9PSEU|nr:enoyl-CoA hydratase/isomerase family protein [Pseudonocardia humida]MCO1656239.1 enoyl-CoA hydratase/isomerase family protein [Pseudonocardia humida]